MEQTNIICVIHQESGKSVKKKKQCTQNFVYKHGKQSKLLFAVKLNLILRDRKGTG